MFKFVILEDEMMIFRIDYATRLELKEQGLLWKGLRQIRRSFLSWLMLVIRIVSHSHHHHDSKEQHWRWRSNSILRNVENKFHNHWIAFTHFVISFIVLSFIPIMLYKTPLVMLGQSHWQRHWKAMQQSQNSLSMEFSLIISKSSSFHHLFSTFEQHFRWWREEWA